MTKQKEAMEKYCAENCDSRCNNDRDCPHEAEFMEMNNIEE